MKNWKSIFKEQPENDKSVAKNISNARTFLLKAARAQGFNPQRALLAIDDILLLYTTIMEKGNYDKTMSNMTNKAIELLKNKWGVE